MSDYQAELAAQQFWLVVAIIAVIAVTVWWSVFVVRFGTMTPRQAAKYRMRQEAKEQREGEAILKARAQLEAEGWKP